MPESELSTTRKGMCRQWLLALKRRPYALGRMCLVGIALAASSRFPLVIAANRDEVFAREAAPLDWWRDEGILAGRDLLGGGTWLGVSPAGRIALVTNVREQTPTPVNAPSRGEIVRYWLKGDVDPEDLERHVLSGFAGVNVLAFDLPRGVQVHVSNRGRSLTTLEGGVHGLSNATIDTPWPKVRALEGRVEAALQASDRERLVHALFAALADDRLAESGLPSTGVPPEIERRLSAAFIRMPELGYGTRCSSVLVREADTLHFVERTFDPSGTAVGDRTFSIPL